MSDTTKDLLIKRRDELIAKKAEIEAKYAPIVAEYESLQPPIDKLINKQKELGKQKRVIQDENKLADLDAEISQVAKALGARTLSGY